jgi:N6-L-threonylcarbamoyladenine synthase
MEGHLLSAMLDKSEFDFPFVALLVSGGHTMLLRAGSVGDYQILGETCDDAAGEAFDKTAKLLGLEYPGGALLATLAEKGNPQAIDLPRPMSAVSAGMDFSFSGLKTHVAEEIRARRGSDGSLDPRERADIAASFQQAAVDTIVLKCLRALKSTGLSRLVIAGGVAANQCLRKTLTEALQGTGATLHCPLPSLCTDNGMMIAYAGWLRLRSGTKPDAQDAPLSAQVDPRWRIEDIDAHV